MKKYWLFLPILIFLIWLAWLVFMIASNANGLGPFGHENTLDFETAGQFGDTFGVISALMAALAASGAYLAFMEQRNANSIQNFEGNFYSLLNHFQQIVIDIDVESVRKRSRREGNRITIDYEVLRRFEGRDGIRRMLEELRNKFEIDDFKDTKIIARKYEEFYDKWSNDLGHYFRLLYNIYRMIDEKCPSDEKYYARIVRAHLSSSELSLLAYNCICGEGREKFVNYLEKYSILHNAHRNNDERISAEMRFFERRLSKDCFRFRALPKITY